jgi:hypothetical protein
LPRHSLAYSFSRFFRALMIVRGGSAHIDSVSDSRSGRSFVANVGLRVSRGGMVRYGELSFAVLLGRVRISFIIDCSCWRTCLGISSPSACPRPKLSMSYLATCNHRHSRVAFLMKAQVHWLQRKTHPIY